MQIGFIGLGNMGSAMIGGIIANKVVKASDITGADASPERTQEIVDKFGITAAGSNNAAARADILVTSVKPQVYEAVIEDIRDTVSDDTVIISIAPGKTLSWLREKYGKPV
nr:NAD(P)-binding domain-containing protein [Lachnospiraceae bacterium]